MRGRWLLIATAIGSVGLSLAPGVPAQVSVCEPTSLEVAVKNKPPDDECHTISNTEHVAAYSWQAFIALNWPAKSKKRGEPDGDDPKQIANRTAPRVWETWKSLQETFLPSGTKPDSWETADNHAFCAKNSNKPDPSPTNDPSPTKVLVDINQSNIAGLAAGPLIAQNRTYVRYEIRMNQVEFEEIAAKGYYRRGQKTITLPVGSIHVKAAWREVRPGENTDRYYRTEALSFNPFDGSCEKRWFVLIGLHIVHKTPSRPQWIWSTFEHVDNLDAPPGTRPSLNNPKAPQEQGNPPPPILAGHKLDPDPEPVQVVFRNSFRPGKAERAQNKNWQESPELEDTVWKYYQLIRTQWPQLPNNLPLGNPFPDKYVANSTMETYKQQRRYTCIQCHNNARNDFAWFINLRAYPPRNVRSNARSFYDVERKFNK